ncbi:LysM peptidoglycan-binding domain-containing protein [Pseudoalteromonas sp. SCSIO 43201]|uniref:LysM peptidoglycan-binding domain-containing protein n=1 Tax=Pseudoalteromonas TaxID=53246 RepID=UPI002075696C|nr:MULTISPECIES: LysM peptidoglycan-binding domain-containing protein [Pseudoalteromonas]MDW7550337.1 LysM peptidoglycan-binding domain-containing protein [Pseudoalteromonas peptidolytica]USD28150.1 LysM peptidoglycan-binding domain-containing protein [Pseudoalteromonas sp. SCSIO 43201]
MNRVLITLYAVVLMVTLSGCKSSSSVQVSRQAILSALTQVPVVPAKQPEASPEPKVITPKKNISSTHEDDLWQYVRHRLSFNTASHPRLDKRIKWYLSQPNYLQVVNQRAVPYFYHVVNKVESKGLPMEIALLPFVESDFRPRAKSTQNAVGVWQLVDATAYHFGIKKDKWYDGRQDVLASTDVALEYLLYLHQRFNGDWLHALAAYNSGEGRVKKAIAKNKKAGKPTHFWHLKLPKETAEYVPKLLALSHLLKTAPSDFTIPSLPNHATTSVLDIGQQFDIGQLAKLSGIDKREIYALNQGFLKHRSSPSGPHVVLLPLPQKALLQSAFFRDNFSHGYTVKANDTLYRIALNAGMSVTALKALNNKTSNLIRVGETLRISKNTAQQQWLIDHEISPYIKEIEAKPLPQRAHHHTVKTGESLWTISRRYNVAVKDLLNWNSLTAQTLIKPGKVLTLLLPAVDMQQHQQEPLPPAPVNRVKVIQSLLRHGKPLANEEPN